MICVICYNALQIVESPYSVCHGRDVEMSTVGGEATFILAMVLDSLVLGDR